MFIFKEDYNKMCDRLRYLEKREEILQYAERHICNICVPEGCGGFDESCMREYLNGNIEKREPSVKLVLNVKEV